MLRTTFGHEPLPRKPKKPQHGTLIAHDARHTRYWIYVVDEAGQGDITSMTRDEWRDFCHALQAGRGLGK
jgi:hypothetical protein